MTPSDDVLKTLTLQLEQLNAKMEQVIRIEAKLRQRKQTILDSAKVNNATSSDLLDILDKEESIIHICKQGMSTAEPLLTATVQETKKLELTKKGEQILNQVVIGINAVKTCLQIWEEELQLWKRFALQTDMTEKNRTIKQITTKQLERDIKLLTVLKAGNIREEEFSGQTVEDQFHKAFTGKTRKEESAKQKQALAGLGLFAAGGTFSVTQQQEFGLIAGIIISLTGFCLIAYALLKK